MPTLPVHATVPPTDLRGQTNGLLEPRLLVPVGKFGQLHHTVARGWFALAAAAKDAGDWNMTWTPGGTYRPYNDQVTTFTSRYVNVTSATYLATPSTDQRRRIWLDGASDFGHPTIYWVKRNIGTPANPRYPATAAVPGTSPHGLACAVDTALDFDESDGITQEDAESNAPALPWLIANARRFGFLWSLQTERWHIQWVVGDSIPQAVLDYEQPNPPPPPPPPPPDQEEDLMFAIYVPTPHATNGQWWASDYDNGNGPAFFAAFNSGVVRRAAGADVQYAADKNLPNYPVVSKEHYNSLLHDSGAQLPAIA